MIYVLVEDSTGYDDCDKPVFAHTDKAVVEAIHDKLVAYHKHCQVIVKQVHEDLGKLHQLMPSPQSPNYGSLPRRPLVWENGKWENAYHLEYLDACRKHNAEVEKEIEILQKKWADFYSISLDELKSMWGHLYDRSYSIDEIEDDPEVDIKKL